MIQGSKVQQCKYPGCTFVAKMTWAQVPLCGAHHEDIKNETARFYSKNRNGVEKELRPQYMKIAHRIPWSKERLSVGEKK